MCGTGEGSESREMECCRRNRVTNDPLGSLRPDRPGSARECRSSSSEDCYGQVASWIVRMSEPLSNRCVGEDGAANGTRRASIYRLSRSYSSGLSHLCLSKVAVEHELAITLRLP